MLLVGKLYRDNSGNFVSIGGRVALYSEEKPWVWSIGGDWYDEVTGSFVMFRGGDYEVLSRSALRSIGDHTVH